MSFSASVLEFYGTLWNFMELYNGSDRKEQL